MKFRIELWYEQILIVPILTDQCLPNNGQKEKYEILYFVVAIVS